MPQERVNVENFERVWYGGQAKYDFMLTRYREFVLSRKRGMNFAQFYMLHWAEEQEQRRATNQDFERTPLLSKNRMKKLFLALLSNGVEGQDNVPYNFHCNPGGATFLMPAREQFMANMPYIQLSSKVYMYYLMYHEASQYYTNCVEHVKRNLGKFMVRFFYMRVNGSIASTFVADNKRTKLVKALMLPFDKHQNFVFTDIRCRSFLCGTEFEKQQVSPLAATEINSWFQEIWQYFAMMEPTFNPDDPDEIVSPLKCVTDLNWDRYVLAMRYILQQLTLCKSDNVPDPRLFSIMPVANTKLPLMTLNPTIITKSNDQCWFEDVSQVDFFYQCWLIELPENETFLETIQTDFVSVFIHRSWNGPPEGLEDDILD